ncbi:hypothetical protein [Jejuia pallidilutea]|uniref:Glucuronyl hydrolase n=1 Tax=Jejuia pallidilutea TaxID=504487 RepID=A0A090W8Q8_9FLAO|nr:hypothetical protein [Jejuia pallidilutea]GAL71859.1 glucuronyl hydrolase [Jejuia pallidilutea]
MKKLTILIIATLSIVLSCKNDTATSKEQFKSFTELLPVRYQKLKEYPLDSLAFPRSVTLSNNTIKKVPSKDWTSGFFAGNLWQIYELTGDEAIKTKPKNGLNL